MRFENLRKKLGKINPETLGDVLNGKTQLTAEEMEEFHQCMSDFRKLFAPKQS